MKKKETWKELKKRLAKKGLKISKGKMKFTNVYDQEVTMTYEK